MPVEPNATELPSKPLCHLSADHPRNYGGCRAIQTLL